MLYRFSIFFVLLTLASCSIDRTINTVSLEDESVLNHFRQLGDKSNLNLVTSTESGEKLALCIVFVDITDGQPLVNQKVQFYQASSIGEYNQSDPSDESTARINGIAFTDSVGRIFLETILPGDYGSSTDNRHIHTTVFDAHPEGYDIHFKQYASFMFANFVDGSDQHYLANLKHSASETLVTFLTIKVKKPLQFP